MELGVFEGWLFQTLDDGIGVSHQRAVSYNAESGAGHLVHLEIVGIDLGKTITNLVGNAKESGVDEIFFPQHRLFDVTLTDKREIKEEFFESK